MRESALVIENGAAGESFRVPVNNIRQATYTKKFEPQLLAMGYLLVSFPTATTSVLLRDARYTALTLAVASLLRVCGLRTFVSCCS